MREREKVEREGKRNKEIREEGIQLERETREERTGGREFKQYRNRKEESSR